MLYFNSMNVLIVFTYNYSLKDWKNTGNLEKELSIYKKLHNDYKINFTFLTYGDEEDLKIKVDCPGIKVIPIYKYLKKYKNKKLNFLQSLIIPFKIKKHITNIDLIKQNQLLGSWVSIILKIIFKVKLFIRTGYDMYLFTKEENKSKLKSGLYYLLTFVTIKLSDLYSVTSKSDLEFFNTKFLNENIIYRPNWVLNDKYYNITNRSTNKILSVGRLEYQKNYDLLISLFKNTNFTIDIVGSGSEKQNLITLAKKNNVNINFLGNLENSELEKLYRQYTFYFSTSLFEGNPKTVLEAMSNGCIVFLSNIPNHSELVEDGLNGFLFDFEEKELIKKLGEVISSKSTLNKISYNAFNTVLEHNSFTSLVNKEHEDYLLLTRI